MDARQFIEQTVSEHPVVLFMKGTSEFPQCGFSGRAVQILKTCGVKNLVTVNVLDDDHVRQAVKEYANWPTVPQLYVNGQFVGRLGHHVRNVPERRVAGAAETDAGGVTPRRLIVAITGASGTLYGTRLLAHLRRAGIETHLVLSNAGALNAHHELGLRRGAIEALADVVHGANDLAASIASGSFQCDGMVIAPCTVKTLAAVAHGFGDNLIARAADVCLKERRRLVLLVREAPLSLAHIRAMEAVTLMGGIVFPPVPAFYLRPDSIEALVDGTLARVLDLLSVEHGIAPRWPDIERLDET